MPTYGAFQIMTLTCLMLIIAGCASSRSGSVYPRSQARQAHSVFYGTVLQVQEVTIEGSQTGIGALSGGVLGGVAGSAIGGGRGSTIAAAAGAIGGMLAGAAAEKGVTTQAGFEIEVELDNGELKVIVQEQDASFAVGDRVRLIAGPDGTWRVRQ